METNGQVSPKVLLELKNETIATGEDEVSTAPQSEGSSSHSFPGEHKEPNEVTVLSNLLASQKISNPQETNYSQEDTQNDSSIFLPRSKSDDDSLKDSVAYLKTKYESPQDALTNKSKTAFTTPPEKPGYYNMSHKRRGKALIFNHDKFDHQDDRPGSIIDRNKLGKQLHGMGFEVLFYDNKTLSDLRQILKEVSSEDHSEADCLVVAVMTHGKSRLLSAKDSLYFAEELWYPFTANNCLTLAGKPKIFFIQACRGELEDPGVQLEERTTHDAGEQSYRIPNQADFFIAFASADGYVSCRDNNLGTWFIKALCSVLEHYGKTHDLLTLMTCVNRRVALEFETPRLDANNRLMYYVKQIPTFSSTLTRHVLFPDKS